MGGRDVFGETPNTATGTVALPSPCSVVDGSTDNVEEPLVLLADGGVARALQFHADMRLGEKAESRKRKFRNKGEKSHGSAESPHALEGSASRKTQSASRKTQSASRKTQSASRNPNPSVRRRCGTWRAFGGTPNAAVETTALPKHRVGPAGRGGAGKGTA